MKNFIILLLQIVSVSTTFAQQSKIIIKGHLPNETERSYTDDVWYYDEFNLFSNTSNTPYPFSVSEGNFGVEVEPNEHYGYFRYRAKFIPSLFIDYFLIQPSDSIFIDILNNNTVVFSGKGSEKLNYQNFAAKEISKATFITKSDTIKYGKINPSRMWMRKMQEGITVCLDSLNKLKTLEENKTIEILRINTIAAFSKNYVGCLGARYPTCDDTEKLIIADQMETMLLQQHLSPINDLGILTYCPAYQDLLYCTQLYYDRLLLNNSIVNSVKITGTYSSFEKNYSGILRDKLITALLIHQDRDNQSIILAEKALEFITDNRSKNIITKLVNSRKVGSAAYPFIFETVEGRTIKLEDLKGKLIIIDTWYYGCTNCAILSKNLTPLVTKYKNSNKVTFLSVNVDKNIVDFKKGVESGLYGKTGVIHAWTRGNGMTDPFIKHNQYIGYPNILIIDENGNVISANPYEKGSEAAQKIGDIIKNNL